MLTICQQKVLSKQLEKAGLKIHVASHGKEALEILKKTNLWHEQAAMGIELSIILMVSSVKSTS
jgi:CheY-like chemotaxis protein